MAADGRGSPDPVDAGGACRIECCLQQVDEARLVDEPHYDADRPRYHISDGSNAGWICPAPERKRSSLAKIRYGCAELSRPEPKNHYQEHGEALLMLELIRDLWQFMRERKKLWLIPVIIIIVLIGLLIYFVEGSAVAPFIYTLF